MALAVAYPNLPEISGLTDYRPKLPLRVYSADGVLLGEFGEERRNFMPIGADPAGDAGRRAGGRGRALLPARRRRLQGRGCAPALANLRDARSQGASTITMQVARNFYLSTEKTFTRKIYEILLALKIESLLSKDQILELYMNQIFLGQRAYGFAAASEIYFGKPLKDVDRGRGRDAGRPAQGAVGLQPDRQPEARHAAPALHHRPHARERLHHRGAARRRAGRDAALPHADRRRRCTPSTWPRRRASWSSAQYGDEAYTRGLNVYLTVDCRRPGGGLPRAAQGPAWTSSGARSTAARRPTSTCRPTRATLDARVAEALADHPDNDELRAAVVLEAGPTKVVAVLQSRRDASPSPATACKPVTSGLADKADPKTQIRRGAVVRVDARTPRATGRSPSCPRSKARSSRMDPRTGAIRALVGGFDFGKSKFNHVTQAWRQPGSSFKPFIYSAALEKGFTPATVVNDAPLFFDAGATGSQPWEPKNYDGKFEGPMPLRTRAGEVEEHGLDPRAAGHRRRSSRRTGSPASASTPTSTRPT